jgi:H+-translocating NAD(P) transhydrogenase subunit alpha
MIVGIPKETAADETRVAITAAATALLIKNKLEVLIESGAGSAAGFEDAAYAAKGAKLADRRTVLASADILLQVRTSTPQQQDDYASLKPNCVLIGFCDPLGSPKDIAAIAAKGVSLIAMELIPRITRAQAMDALSSQASLAGYKAVIMAADTCPRVFPMMMTAAGTIAPAKVFVIGAGVAGLQAIATAKRLGAVVSGFDVRPAVKEQVQSVGAKFVELPLETGDVQDKGGYAKAISQDLQRKQAALMAKVIAESDVVITTAAVPGKPAPKLIFAAAVERMQPGSVIIDLAAERGGNCELTVPGKTIVHHGVTIIGHLNLAATVPYHASSMYANNLVKLVALLVDKEAKLKLDVTDEVIAGCLACHQGAVVHPRIKELLAASAPSPERADLGATAVLATGA